MRWQRRLQRYKGHEWNSSGQRIRQPEFRQVNIENGREADRVFSLMGDEVPPRREFIEQNAKYANIA